MNMNAIVMRARTSYLLSARTLRVGCYSIARTSDRRSSPTPFYLDAAAA